MDSVSPVILAIGSVITAVVGSVSLLIRARGAAARPMQVLQRLWDWVQTAHHDDEVPETLRRDVEKLIGEELEERP